MIDKKNSSTIIKDIIGETSLLALYMRSLESKKKKGIIKDSMAIQLVDKIDYDFEKWKKYKVMLTSIALRTNYFDNQLISFIQRRKKPVIVIVGCGLDSRYNRIKESVGDAKFYQLDIPEVIDIRKQYIPVQKNEKYISASMLEDEWIKQIKEENLNGEFLFIIEGVLVYFTEKDVKSTFRKLANNFSNSEILFDMISTKMSKAKDTPDSVKLVGARFRFGTDNDKEMETWANNLQHKSTKRFADFSTWKRGIISWELMILIPSIRKGARLLHYKIA